jgi:DNA integrity scanning protein DisA with diadenylate cyclase activity
VDILNRLARRYGLDHRTRDPVGWGDFERTTDDQLETLDEALFETAHLIAGLASADGAVVMTKQHDLLGFGGMISGRLPAVRSVARALDLEGERVTEEEVENVGARHRSAYRLAGALPGSVVIVISQDGGVRFVCEKDGRVTYWEQE